MVELKTILDQHISAADDSAYDELTCRVFRAKTFGAAAIRIEFGAESPVTINAEQAQELYDWLGKALGKDAGK